MTSSAPVASAMASASAFWSRCGSWLATWPATAPRPSECRRVSPRSRACRSRSRYERDHESAGPSPGSARRWVPTSTFWSTVYSRNSAVAWNVRAMPRRQISDGRSPEIRSRLKRISPAVRGMTPVIRLKTVLLPAPLGPMRPWIEPGATVMERSATACRPPKRRETPRSSRSKAGSCGCRHPRAHSAEQATGRAGKRHEPLRREEHRQDEDGAEDEELRGDRHEDRADHRSPYAAGAADHREDDQQHHGLQAEIARVQDLAVVGEEDACEPGHEAAEYEGGQLVTEDVHAQGLGHEVRLADRARGQAEPRAVQPDEGEHHDYAQHGHQSVERELTVEDEPEQPAGLRNSHQPRGHTEEPFEEVVEEEPDDLREGERDQEIVWAAHAQGDAPDGNRQQRRHQRADPEGGPEGKPRARHQERRGVGADPHEGDVGHVDLPGAHLEPEAHRQGEIHQVRRRDVEVVRVARDQRQRGGPERDQRHARRGSGGATLHRRAPAAARAEPRSP